MTPRFFTPFLWLVVAIGCSSNPTTPTRTEEPKPPASQPAPTTITSSVINARIHGAVGDGRMKDTQAIQAAIDAVAVGGGGTVYFPPGIYLTGSLVMKDHVALYVDRGATLLASIDTADFPSYRCAFRSYTDTYVQQSLIRGEGLQDIAVLGPGTIEGRGDDPVWACPPGNGRYRERPYLIRFVSCRKVRIREVTLSNSPMWTQHYLDCEDVTLENLTVTGHNPNNDMMDIDCCRDVRVWGCHGDTEDDAITLKSTADRPTRDVTITNCVVSSRCNAIKLGTESNGGFQNITITNVTVRPSRVKTAKGQMAPGLSGIALEMVDGGTLDGVIVSDITIEGTLAPIFLRLGNRARPFKEGMAKPGFGTFRNVVIGNVTATGTGNFGCSITGLPEHPVENVTLHDIRISFAGGGTLADVTREVPELETRYPEGTMFGRLPTYGFYVRHAIGLTLRNVNLEYVSEDHRPTLYCDDVRHLSVDTLAGRCAKDTPAMIVLKDVADAMIRGCSAPEGTTCFLQLVGKSRGISVLGNDLSRAALPFEAEEGGQASVLFQSGNQLPDK